MSRLRRMTDPPSSVLPNLARSRARSLIGRLRSAVVDAGRHVASVGNGDVAAVDVVGAVSRPEIRGGDRLAGPEEIALHALGLQVCRESALHGIAGGVAVLIGDIDVADAGIGPPERRDRAGECDGLLTVVHRDERGASRGRDHEEEPADGGQVSGNMRRFRPPVQVRFRSPAQCVRSVGKRRRVLVRRRQRQDVHGVAPVLVADLPQKARHRLGPRSELVDRVSERATKNPDSSMVKVSRSAPSSIRSARWRAVNRSARSRANPATCGHRRSARCPLSGRSNAPSRRRRPHVVPMWAVIGADDPVVAHLLEENDEPIRDLRPFLRVERVNRPRRAVVDQAGIAGELRQVCSRWRRAPYPVNTTGSSDSRWRRCR